MHKHIDKNEHDIERINVEIKNLASNYVQDANKLYGQMAMMENFFKLADLASVLDKTMDKLLQIKKMMEKRDSAVAWDLTTGFYEKIYND
jgi:hypothetical protein